MKLTVQMKVLLGLCLLSVISMMVATSTFETGMGDGAQLLRAEAQNARAMKAAVRSHVGENPLVATRGVRDASASVDAEFAASHFCQEDTRALRRALGLDPASRGAGLLGAGRPHPHLAHELAAHIARLALLRVGAGARWGVGAPRAEGRSPARRLVHAPRASVLGALLLLLHLEEQLVVRGALLSLRLAQVRACGGGSACAGGGACARARCARQARLQPRGARERCIGRREWGASARAGRDARDEERARPPPPSRRGESPPPAVAGRATKLSRARAAPSTASQLVAAGPAVEGRGRAARAEGRTAPALRPPPSAPTKAEAPSWRRRGPALVGRARGRRLLPPRLARTAVTLAPAAADTDPPAPPPGLASLRRRDDGALHAARPHDAHLLSPRPRGGRVGRGGPLLLVRSRRVRAVRRRGRDLERHELFPLLKARDGALPEDAEVAASQLGGASVKQWRKPGPRLPEPPQRRVPGLRDQRRREQLRRYGAAFSAAACRRVIRASWNICVSAARVSSSGARDGGQAEGATMTPGVRVFDF